MNQRLHVLMPCAKGRNIPKLSDSYLFCEGHAWELRWHILQQGSENDPKGFRKINEALNWIQDGWFFTPSDDTIHHPSLFRRAGEIVAANPKAKAIVFSQNRPAENRILRAHPDNMKPSCVDGSQTIWNRGFVGSRRYEYDKHREEADGYLSMELYQSFPNSFVFVDEVLTNFNSLEWK